MGREGRGGRERRGGRGIGGGDVMLFSRRSQHGAEQAAPLRRGYKGVVRRTSNRCTILMLSHGVDHDEGGRCTMMMRSCLVVQQSSLIAFIAPTPLPSSSFTFEERHRSRRVRCKVHTAAPRCLEGRAKPVHLALLLRKGDDAAVEARDVREEPHLMRGRGFSAFTVR